MFKFNFASLKARRLFYRVVLFVGDGVLVVSSLCLAYLSRFHWDIITGFFPVTKGVPGFDLYVPVYVTALIVWMFAFVLFGFYRRISLLLLDELLRVFRGVVAGWVIVLAGTFLYRGVDYSRMVLGLSCVYAFVSVLSFRLLMKLLYNHIANKWWEPHTVLVIGEGRMSQSIQKVLKHHPELSVISKGICSSSELQVFLKRNKVREVFVGVPDLDHTTLIEMSEVCDEFELPFRIVPDVLELRMGEVVIDDSLGMPTYQIKPMTLHGWTYFFKHLTDVLISIGILSILIFPLIFIAVWIRIDSEGPILLKQLRAGHRCKPFYCYKFRTMVENADQLLEELKAKNDRGGPVFKMKNDPRITRVGKWLRKFSLDEVPQILNILRAEMSLVGPRPQVLWEAAAYDNWARKRLNVLPGITGLWQVSGRAHLSYEQMIDLDVYYVEHWSPGLDLKIILRTIPTVLGAQGAY